MQTVNVLGKINVTVDKVNLYCHVLKEFRWAITTVGQLPLWCFTFRGDLPHSRNTKGTWSGFFGQ